MIALHPGLRQWIQDYACMWAGSPERPPATDEDNTDDISGVIIKAYWQRLRDNQSKMH